MGGRAGRCVAPLFGRRPTFPPTISGYHCARWPSAEHSFAATKLLFNQINCTTMSYVKDNLVTEGLAGKLGNRFCFRIVNGKTCLYRIGLRSGEQTDAQLEVQEKFKLAAAQARADLKDATKKAEWEAAAQASAKYKTAFGAAMAHYYGTL